MMVTLVERRGDVLDVSFRLDRSVFLKKFEFCLQVSAHSDLSGVTSRKS